MTDNLYIFFLILFWKDRERVGCEGGRERAVGDMKLRSAGRTRTWAVTLDGATRPPCDGDCVSEGTSRVEQIGNMTLCAPPLRVIIPTHDEVPPRLDPLWRLTLADNSFISQWVLWR